MIAIRNISPKVEPIGMHEYEVRINRDLITTFWHNREDGLVLCLKKASEAVYDEFVWELNKKKKVKSSESKKRIKIKDEARKIKKGS